MNNTNIDTNVNAVDTEKKFSNLSGWRRKLLDFEDRVLRSAEDAKAYREHLREKRMKEGYSR